MAVYKELTCCMILVLTCARTTKSSSTAESAFREWCELAGIQIGPVSFNVVSKDQNERLVTATQVILAAFYGFIFCFWRTRRNVRCFGIVICVIN